MVRSARHCRRARCGSRAEAKEEGGGKRGGQGAVRILAIDPGTTESAWVVWDGERILEHGKIPNSTMRDSLVALKQDFGITECCIEMVASFGMPVGAEV